MMHRYWRVTYGQVTGGKKTITFDAETPIGVADANERARDKVRMEMGGFHGIEVEPTVLEPGDVPILLAREPQR